MFHMKQGLPGGFVTVSGLRTHVVVSGGGPTVVLCGGLASNWFDWDDCAAILSAFHTVVILDRPGFGFSEPFPRGAKPTVTAEADRIRGVLDALELPGPAVIVGHSIAGFYAEAFARLYPERTSGVLLLDSSAERNPRGLFPTDLRLAVAYAVAAVLSEFGLQRLLGTTAYRVLNQAIPPDGIPIETYDWIAQIYRMRSYLQAALVEYFAYPDMARELNTIRCATPTPDIPIIVAAAHTGRPTPWGRRWLAKQRRLAQYLKARFVVVTEAHHHAMIDQPVVVAALISELV